MAANGISTLSTKEERQKAKLDLAASNRAGDGNPRAEYDITQLPTQYYGNNVTNNANAGGLVQGRPWITGSGPLYFSGLWRITYTGYFNDVPGWFDANYSNNQGFGFASANITVGSAPTTTSYQWLGYFLPRYTDTYTFTTMSDDASYVWVGDVAKSGYTTSNALVNNGGQHGLVTQTGTISLTAGVYYPIRIQYGNNGGPGIFTCYAESTNTSGFMDQVFCNPLHDGFID